MAEYSRLPQRFFFAGLSLLPSDALGPAKLPFVQNVRSYQEGALQPREGSILASVAPLAGAGGVHTLARLNDSSPFATVPSIRLAGAGGTLYKAVTPALPTPGTYIALDGGYSGDPLSVVIAQPARSPQPWAYIHDRTRLRKTNVNGTVFPIGITQPSAPSTEPTTRLGQPGVTVISDFNNPAEWALAGAIAAAPVAVNRLTTTISAILYDNGPGSYATVAPGSMENIGTGTLLTLGGGEVILVTDITIAIADTTIAAIQYDQGVNGLCTIQPAASLGTGQLDGPDPALGTGRYGYALDTSGKYGLGRAVLRTDLGPAVPSGASPLPTDISRLAPSTIARSRQIDFPVNCLVMLNAIELVRILSVAVGRDGIQSFRCFTAGTYAPGQSIVGTSGFRAFVAGNYGGGTTLTADGIQQGITPVDTIIIPPATVATPRPAVGGVQATPLAVNGALVGGLATTPDDEIHLSIKADRLSNVTEIRVYLDVDGTPATQDFLHNYYLAVWRANDLIAAIQTSNAVATVPLSIARAAAIVGSQVDGPISSSTDGPPQI